MYHVVQFPQEENYYGLSLSVEILRLKRSDDLYCPPDVRCHGPQSLARCLLTSRLQLSLAGACSANAETVLRCRQCVFCVGAKWKAGSGSSHRKASWVLADIHHHVLTAPVAAVLPGIALLCQQQQHSC